MTQKLSVPWAGNPVQQGQEYITLADVIGVQNSSEPGNSVNSITLNLGVAHNGETYTRSAMMFQPPGLISIPQGPGSYDSGGTFNASNTSATSAQAVAYVRNDQWITLGFRDTRTQFTPGNLQPGETSVYATGSAARTLYKLDGTVVHMTTSSDGSSQMTESISPNGWNVMTPFGSITLDANGFSIRLSNGAAFTIGGLNFAGLGGVSSYAMLNAGLVAIPAATVQLGLPGPEGYQQVVYPLAPTPTGTPLPLFSTTPCSSVYVGL